MNKFFNRVRKVLVVYFSQTGQLTKIINNVLTNFYDDSEIQVDIEILKPEPEYPFPWKGDFFDPMPDSVKGTPCQLGSFTFNPETKYDLIILGIQSWFLSPSVPVTSFLKSADGQKVINSTPVITIHGSRNMWFSSQEFVKKHIHNAGGNLVANIALADKHQNYISAITIIKWLVHGNKGPSKLLPEAGISTTDIERAKLFSPKIKKALAENNYKPLHANLLKLNSVYIRFHIMNIEFTARKIFVKFANYIDRKEVGTQERKKRINQFKIYLLFVLFVLSPLVAILYRFIRILFFPLANKQINYYKGITLKQ